MEQDRAVLALALVLAGTSGFIRPTEDPEVNRRQWNTLPQEARDALLEVAAMYTKVVRDADAMAMDEQAAEGEERTVPGILTLRGRS